MSSTEPANARLTRVQGARSSDDEYEGTAGTPGAEKWHGNVGAFYDERRERITGEGGGSDIRIRRLLEVSSDLPVAWAAGDVVTFRPAGQAAATDGIVRLVAATPPPDGEGGDVELELEDE